MASELLNAHRFKDRSEKKIWELHCEGLTVREISTRVSCPKSTVHWLITRISKVIKGNK